MNSKQIIKASKITDKILAIIDDKDKLTRSDLQGAIEAIIITAIITKD